MLPRCGPTATVTFVGVTLVKDLPDDDLDAPRFRVVDDVAGARVFCIEHGTGSTVRIVAADATVEHLPQVR